jgi:dethiobiotin synthetase
VPLSPDSLLAQHLGKAPKSRIVFITGTDTGVGKTVLTSLLLVHLRSAGYPAYALKPFCSGGRGDARLLQCLQDGDLTLQQVNPFHFPEPLAPLVAARRQGQRIQLKEALEKIGAVCSGIENLPLSGSKIRSPILLVEGAGGLLAPLGERFTAADVIEKLGCNVVVVAANRLGTLNHTTLTVKFLQYVGVQALAVVTIDVEAPAGGLHSSGRRQMKMDLAARTNPEILSELLDPIPVFHIPHLPRLAKNHGKTEVKSLLMTCGKKLKKTLAQILQ